eukprot:m.73340 g.73340  ORF g.73340 m.73340 type:complete len:83 (+) comp16123_c0_seq2:498-746(+)
MNILEFFISQASLSGGCSYSRQYMEGIWWHSEEQKNVVLDKLTKLKAAQRPCEVRHEAVTSIYRAEEYHQRYYAKLSAKRKW